MTLHHLTGNVEVALSHLALCGLVSIADESTGTASRLWWTADQTPVPTVQTTLDASQLAAAVHAHAQRAADPASWLMRRETAGTRAGAGLFTARAKVPADPGEWRYHVEEIRAARRSMTVTRLDGQMLLGLGEPAWWRWERDANRPDEGASRWEMKTRNQGQEFLLHRLAPLAQTLAQRTPQEIFDGLVGRSVVDETGMNASESRTATGLTTPGPVDSAVAWCALWGLAVAPPIPRKTAISRTPGVWPDERLHPTRAALPVFTHPVTVARFSQILLSEAFDTAGAALSGGDSDAGLPISRGAAAAWLIEQGVRAVVVFPVRKTGSASAPERQILSGEVKVLP